MQETLSRLSTLATAVAVTLVSAVLVDTAYGQEETVRAGKYDNGKMWTFDYPPVEFFQSATESHSAPIRNRCAPRGSAGRPARARSRKRRPCRLSA